MRRLARVLPVVLSLAALAARPADAARMLIATAATAGRLDRFCLSENGTFATKSSREPIYLDKTSPGNVTNPRSMLFVPDPNKVDAGTLYVAEPDRVEAIRFDAKGNVKGGCPTTESYGDACRQHTEVVHGMDARAVAVNDPNDPTVLYVAQYGLDRITAYDLDENGLPPQKPEVGDKFKSCVQARTGAGYGELAVVASSTNGGFVYVSAEGGRLDVFGTKPDGRLCSCAPCFPKSPDDTNPCLTTATCPGLDPLADPITNPGTDDRCIPTTSTECPTSHCSNDASKACGDDSQCGDGNRCIQVTPKPTMPIQQRRKLDGPTFLFVLGPTLVIQEGISHRMATFQVADLLPVQKRDCASPDHTDQKCVCDSGTRSGLTCVDDAFCQKPASPSDPEQSTFCGFQPKICVAGVNLGKTCKDSTAATDCPDSKCGQIAPQRASRSQQTQRYLQMVQTSSDTVIGSQFFNGRLDAFRLQEPGESNCKLTSCPDGFPRCCLPKAPSSHSKADVRMSPVGMAVGHSSDDALQALYVSGGDDNRVRAYPLTQNGNIGNRAEQFDETDDAKGSFPNAVAIAVLPGACPQ